MSLTDQLAALWPKIRRSSRLGGIICALYACEAAFYLGLAGMSPHAPDLSSGQVIPFPLGRHSTFYVDQTMSDVLLIMMVQMVVTLLPIVAIWMASHPTDMPDEPSSQSLPSDER